MAQAQTTFVVHLCTSHESHEGYEGHEERWCHECFWWLCCCCREQRVETESGQGRYHWLHGIGCQRTQKEWCLQGCWSSEHEVEEEACCPSPQRYQSVHQGAMCLQGQTS